MNCETCFPLLQRILEELRVLRADLHPRRCTAADLEALGRLLPAIAGRWGSNPVRVKEILSDRAIRAISGSPGSTGGLLSRAAADGVTVGNLCVERISREHGAILWRVVCRLPEPLDRPPAPMV